MLRNLSTGIEASASGESLNSGDVAVHPAARHIPNLGRNRLSSSAALANGVKTIMSALPALRAKGEHFPLRADHTLYFLDAILPELASEYANVGETSRVMLWHCRLGHINAQSVKKLAEEKGRGMVVKDRFFPSQTVIHTP